MDFNDFQSLVLSRQACRDFNDLPLEKEKVEEIAKLAKYAPSACNSQPWKMYCVTEGERLEEVKKALQRSGRNKFLEKAKAVIAVTEKATTLKPAGRPDANTRVRWMILSAQSAIRGCRRPRPRKISACRAALPSAKAPRPSVPARFLFQRSASAVPARQLC